MASSVIERLTDDYVNKVTTNIYKNINSPVELVNQVCTHLIANGGKRIRPRLMFLCAGLINGPQACNNQDLINMAAAIEIIHTSTLMHDDVIDESAIRRGQDTTNVAFNNYLAVLGGDYLFTRAFCMANNVSSQTHRLNISNVLANAIGVIVQGEIEQMQNIANTALSEETYFKTIYSKTAALFEVSAQITSILFDLDSTQTSNLTKYARHLGNAFQIADDIMDYTSTKEQMGKSIGDDLNNEKITLPFIYLINDTTDKQKNKELITAFREHDIQSITQALHAANTIQKCQDRALQEATEAQKCLVNFPDSIYKDALYDMVYKAAKRDN